MIAPPAGFELDQTDNSAPPPPGFELDQNQQSEQPQQPKSNGILDMVSNAVGQTPLGMAAQGANSAMQGIGKVFTPFIPAETIGKAVSPIFQGFRALGVGVAKNIGGQMMGVNPSQNIANTVNRAQAAYQPGYQPQGMAESIGSTIGENAPTIAAQTLSPGVGGPLTFMAQQAAETGKMSPVPLIPPLFKGISKAGEMFKLRERVIPPLLKSTKGIPTEVSKMAIKEPDILGLPGTSESIQQKSQGIIDAIKEAERNVGRDFGAAYKEQGMNSPIDEIINGRTAQKSLFGNRSYEVAGEPISKTQSIPGYSYKAEGNPILKTQNVPGYSYRGVGNPAPTGINPSEINNSFPGSRETVPGRSYSYEAPGPEKQINVPGRSYNYMEEGPNKSISINDVSGTSPSVPGEKSFHDLRSEYQSAMSGDLFKIKNTGGGYGEMPITDKLTNLTDLKRSLQDRAIYPQAGQQLSPSQGAYNAAIKKMAADIDQLRGTIPGGEKLAIADDAWSEMKAIKQRLMSSFKDPYTGQDYLNRILKGNTDWLTSGRNAGRIGAIERVEEITGKQVLKPALREMAAAYLNNPDVLSLPSFGLKSIISSLVPTKSLFKGGGLINFASKAIGTPAIGSKMMPDESTARKFWNQAKSEGLKGEEAKKRARELMNGSR